MPVFLRFYAEQKMGADPKVLPWGQEGLEKPQCP